MNKFLLTVLAISLAFFGCKQKSHEHEGQDHEASEAVSNNENQALYDEVMKVHDEVMPKMDDIYKLKQSLAAKAANASEEQKKDLQQTIQKLDSASEGMMVWMRQFKPIPDSEGEQKAREYLENEMERVKKVKEDMLEALEEGKKKL